jgi:transcriptional regulator with XRE-family HTH domain
MSETTAARPRRGRPVVSPSVTAASPSAYVLGVNVRRIREHQGLEQDQLGEIAGWGRTRISQIETVKRGCNLATVDKLAEALGVTAAELLTPPAEAGAE